MRILDKTSLTLGLPELGYLSDDQATMEKILGFAEGIFLVTLGPTRIRKVDDSLCLPALFK